MTTNETSTTIKLEVGKIYLTREGKLKKITRNRDGSIYPYEYQDEYGGTYLPNGLVIGDKVQHPDDLLSEAVW